MNDQADMSAKGAETPIGRREFLRAAARLTTMTGLVVLAGRLGAEWYATGASARCTNAGRCGGCGKQAACALPDAVGWRRAATEGMR